MISTSTYWSNFFSKSWESPKATLTKHNNLTVYDLHKSELLVSELFKRVKSDLSIFAQTTNIKFDYNTQRKAKWLLPGNQYPYRDAWKKLGKGIEQMLQLVESEWTDTFKPAETI